MASVRKLDFIVFGTARSGTTATARYLSASDKLHCAVEIFGLYEDHSQLFMPRELYRRGCAPERPDKIVAYGHKLPLYYRRLDGVFNEIGSRKAIVCYRDLRATAESYMLRARNGTREWPYGRVDIFACADLMVMAKALAQHSGDDILISPHRSLYKDWRKTIEKIAHYLTPGLSLQYDEQQIDMLRYKKEHRGSLSRPLIGKKAEKAIETIRKTGILRVLDNSSPFLLSKRRRRLLSAVKKLPSDHVDYFGSLTEDSPNHIQSYFRRWSQSES